MRLYDIVNLSCFSIGSVRRIHFPDRVPTRNKGGAALKAKSIEKSVDFQLALFN